MIWLVRKDLLRFFADRQGALMAVLVPVVLAALLGMLFAPREGNSRIGILVADGDGGPAVRRLVEAIDASPSLEVREMKEAEARAKLAAGEASLALILPPGTEAALAPARMFAGVPGTVTLLYDPSDSTEANIAEGLLTQLLMQQVMGGMGDRDGMRKMFVDLEGQLGAQASDELRDFLKSGRTMADDLEPDDGGEGGGVKPPVTFDKQEVVASGPAAGYNSYAHNFAGMLLLFLLFGGQSAAKQLVTERDEGTLLRIRLSPLSPSSILLASGVSAMVVALLTSVAVYAVGMLVFGIRVGSWPGFVLMVVAVCAFVGGFTLLLAGLGRTEQRISAIGSFTVLVMSFVGGAMFPSFMMPEWLQTAAQVLPTHWATRGLAAMTWRGLPFASALLPTAILLVSAGLCALVGIRRFSWR